jgi:hypothetical protein
MIDLDAVAPTPSVSVAGRFVNVVSAAHLAELLASGAARLEIEAPARKKGRWATYAVQRLETAYRLTPDAEHAGIYNVAIDLSACDCGDGTYRAARTGGCRHRVALRQALAAFGG